MTRAQLWSGIALLYAIGLAAAFVIAYRHQLMHIDARAALALLVVPLAWGIGPMVLTAVWLAFKRDLAAARFGLLIFAALYLVIAGFHLWWGELL